jgi:error-prone DNA polymerase
MPLTEGREVVEDYRSIQLSLRAHPVSFLREELSDMKIVSCGDLPNQRDGRNLEVAGIVLVRQRPGSAKGVLFVTIEDETGVANAILWPDKFETYRRQIMSASMIAVRGRMQKEGEIIHVIADRITNLDPMLRSIGRQDLNPPHGRGDGAAHGGGPDPRDPGFPKGRVLAAPAFRTDGKQDDILPVRSHDFH